MWKVRSRRSGQGKGGFSVFALFAHVTRRARKVLSHSSSLLPIAVYPLYTPAQSCSRRSWVAPPVSAPSQPASLHRPAPSPTACLRHLARLFFRANADSRQARPHARPTVTRTALVSLWPSPIYRHLVRQSRVPPPQTSPTRPVAMSRPPRMRLLPTCPVCPRLSTSSLKVRKGRSSRDWNKPLTLFQILPYHLSSVSTVPSAWAPPSHPLQT